MALSSQNEISRQTAKTLAAIDIGSSLIRMVLAQILPNGRLEIIERLQRAAPLGHDTFRYGRLRREAMRAAVLILRDYQDILRTYSVQELSVVATSAVREAENADIFLDRVLVATGLQVEIIPASEQSRLTVAAIRHSIGQAQLARRNSVVAEVGGGSTVLNLLRSGEIAASQNLPLGAIRLLESLSTNQESGEMAQRLIRDQAMSTLSTVQSLLPLKRIQTFYAVGADARWAADLVGRSAGIEDLRTIRKTDMKKLITRHSRKTADELAKTYGLTFADAETLIPALIVYEVLLDATRASEMYVSNVSMRDGLLLDLARRVSGDQDESVINEVVRSAVVVAEKYCVDLKHANQVKDLAGRLFDELEPEHQLSTRYRLLLQLAALLHEAGSFVSSRAHHKHSYYLIANSEIWGLTQEELAVVALVARYHRKSRPKPSHLEYMRLPRDQRILVNKLAALLRVADALDISHTRHIGDLECKVDNDGLVIVAKPTADITLERKSLAAKKDMFEDVFGLRVRIEVE
jgi:exopolyphosphatase/guanosine-5'-triphosphate,3'-diphosphate pyrophosphatase